MDSVRVRPMPRPLPALHRLAPRAFYGWFVAVGASGLAFVSVGIGFYCQVVFLHGLVGERGWSTASVAGASSLYFVFVGLCGHAIGRPVDRYGPRRFIAIGAGLMAAALLALGSLSAPWQLYPVYLLLAAGFALAGSVPSSALVTRWFEARRARAMAIAQTGVSVGGVVLVPLATGWIAADGVGTATHRLALLLLVVALPITLAVLRDDPRTHGLRPDGAGAAPPGAPARGVPQRRWTVREARRTRSFRLLALAFSIQLFVQVAFAIHQLAFLSERLPATTAALAVSTTAAGSIAGRLAVGAVADRMRLERLAAALFLTQAVALALFASAERPVWLFAASLGFGATIGNVFMLQSLLVGQLFGAASYGAVYGALQLVTQLGSGLGPAALGLAFERLGGYPLPLGVLAALAVAAAAIVARVRPPRAPHEGAAARR